MLKAINSQLAAPIMYERIVFIATQRCIDIAIPPVIDRPQGSGTPCENKLYLQVIW